PKSSTRYGSCRGNDMTEPEPKHLLPRGHPLLAWVVILAACAFVVWRNFTPAESSNLPPPKIDATNPLLIIHALGMFGGAALGLSLVVLWGVLVGLGRLRLRMHAYPHYGAVYAETFALWMLIYLGLGYGMRWLPVGRSSLLVSGA